MASEVSRTCIGCGEVHDKKTMIRIVRDSQGVIRSDESGRANGRGAYICLNEECLDKAVKKQGLNRAFKMQVSKDTVSEVSEYIRNRLAES
ncbi:MAG: YlxR family protein [Lachnospiraceae bacterium]|nr:YlxR family protein [Lachnospiraceae bacterium]